MRHIKNIFKISIVLLLLLVCLGSIYAADNSQVSLNDNSEDDFDLDEFDDEEIDESDDGDDDWDLDDDNDDDDLDDSDDDSDDDFDDDEDLDDSDDNDDDDLDDDIDFNESDYIYSDFDYLKFKITFYLDRYGNCSDHNWTESEEFLSEYQIYLLNPSNYTLNESSEGYETYLKIYDSITSTFNDYNLTENETDYLKFMVIFYLNHYGNVSANYTWNESESFANFTPPIYLLGALWDIAMGNASSSGIYDYFHLNNVKSLILSNITDTNSTSNVNATGINSMDVHNEESWWNYLIIGVLVVIMLMLVLI